MFDISTTTERCVYLSARSTYHVVKRFDIKRRNLHQFELAVRTISKAFRPTCAITAKLSDGNAFEKRGPSSWAC